MKTPVTPPARRAVAFGLGTALLATVAGLCASAPASAATGPGWTPSEHNLPWIPTTDADGEITVAAIPNADPSGARAVSYQRDGLSMAYATPFSAKDLAWAPGGDALAVVSAGGSNTPELTPAPVDPARVVSRPTSGLWSPFGESMTATAKSLTTTPFTVRAAWVGANRSEALTPALGEDPGVGAPTPDGLAMVLTVRDADTGKRDLATVDADFPRSGNPMWNAPLDVPTPLGFGELDAHDPVVSNDGTLAFTGTGPDGLALFVVEGDAGPVQVALLGEPCDGQRPSFSPSGHSIAYVWSTPGCLHNNLRILDKNGDTFVGGFEDITVSSSELPAPLDDAHFANPSWRPRTPAATTTRLGGADRVATGIAASRDGWPEGSDGAIIASSTSFPDALVAGPLSGASNSPLLINPATKLDARVLAELKRLMPATADRFVYIVGGTGVVSAAVQTSLKNNGFVVSRLSGTDRFRTSVRVAQELDLGYRGSEAFLTRDVAFLADGMNFPDALSAGPAASTFFASVLLTNGATTPDVVKSYVNGRTAITKVHAIGGQAAKAVGTFGSKAGERISGADRFATSALVAQRWFPGASRVGYANGTSFPDAVTGGASMSAYHEPLLLVSAKAVPSSVNAVSRAFRTATDDVAIFGGTAVVSDGVRAQVANNAGTQTAMWGLAVDTVDNPLWVEPLGVAATKVPSRSKVPGRSQAPSRSDDAPATSGPTAGFRSAHQR